MRLEAASGVWLLSDYTVSVGRGSGSYSSVTQRFYFERSEESFDSDFFIDTNDMHITVKLKQLVN